LLWVFALGLWRAAASAEELTAIDSDRSPCVHSKVKVARIHARASLDDRTAKDICTARHCPRLTTHGLETHLQSQSHTPAAMSSMFDLAGAKQ
jgi:hypothetical protein